MGISYFVQEFMVLVGAGTLNHFVDEGESANITCPFNKITMTNGLYYSNKSGCKKNVLPILKKHCNDKIECTITASSDALGGDPCENKKKTLSYSFRCLDD